MEATNFHNRKSRKRYRRQRQAEAIASRRQGQWGTKRADLRLIARAAREGWPVAAGRRQALGAVAVTGLRSPYVRNGLAACNAMVAMAGANLRELEAELLQRPVQQSTLQVTDGSAKASANQAIVAAVFDSSKD